MNLLHVDGHACIIGVGDPKDLPYTANDAEGLAHILTSEERCAYNPNNVRTLVRVKATKQEILTTLEGLAAQTNLESTVIIYFSGHGYEVKTENRKNYYLMPFGYSMKRLDETAISGQEFAKCLAAIPAQKLVLILDCCHAGGFAATEAETKDLDGQLIKSPMPVEAQQVLAQGEGRVILASSSAAETSFAGRPYSAFTAALIEGFSGQGLSTPDGYVRWLDLFGYVRAAVSMRTKQRQNPMADINQKTENFKLAFYAAGDTAVKALPFDDLELDMEPGSGKFTSVAIPVGRDLIQAGRDFFRAGRDIIVGNKETYTATDGSFAAKEMTFNGPVVTGRGTYHTGDTVQGNKIEGDKVGGDKITVGTISGSQGIAIGTGFRAEVQTGVGAESEGSDPKDLKSQSLGILLSLLRKTIDCSGADLTEDDQADALDCIASLENFSADRQDSTLKRSAGRDLRNLKRILDNTHAPLFAEISQKLEL
ncbi:MAG: caspase family protein [Cyanobacteria bacterium P01_F01_bin.86]